MKKIALIAVPFILCLYLAGCGTSVRKQQGPLYIVSESAAEDALSYAKEEAERLFLCLNDTIEDELSQLDKDAVLSYGTAFRLGEINYIPIVSGGKILVLLAVFEDIDGKYAWTLSESFSPELNNIAELTSIDTPAKLYTKKSNLYADISGEIYPLTSHPDIPTIDDPEELERLKQADMIDILYTNHEVEYKVSDILRMAEGVIEKD